MSSDQQNPSQPVGRPPLLQGTCRTDLSQFQLKRTKTYPSGNNAVKDPPLMVVV